MHKFDYISTCMTTVPGIVLLIKTKGDKMEQQQDDIMTEGEVWRVNGLLCGDPFEVKFTSWDSYDPEAKARTFYNGQSCLINTSLTVQRITRTWEKPVESKDGPETRESGGPCLPDEAS